MFQVTIYVDTSTLGATAKLGAYGYVVEYRKPDNTPVTRQGFGTEENTTGNRLSLLAITEALSELKKPCYVRVNTGCPYILNICQNHYLSLWKKNGWRNAKDVPVKNVDLWENYLKLTRNHTMEIGRPTEEPYQLWLMGEIRRELDGKEHLTESKPKRMLPVPQGSR